MYDDTLKFRLSYRAILNKFSHYLTTNYITDCLNYGNEWLQTYKIPKKVQQTQVLKCFATDLQMVLFLRNWIMTVYTEKR